MRNNEVWQLTFLFLIKLSKHNGLHANMETNAMVKQK